MPSTASTRRVGRLVLGILLRRIPMPSLPRVRGEATRSRQSRRMSPRGSRKSKKAPDRPGLGSTRCGHAAGVLLQVQRHSAGRYFADSVVPAPLQAQVMGPAGGVPAASAAPADVGTIAMFLPFSIFVP